MWSFTRGGELVDAVGGACLDVAGRDGRAGANVGVYGCERLEDQRWTLASRGDGSFELHNRQAGMCLDVKGHSGAKGDNVLLWNCDGGADQRWWWEPLRRPIQDPPPPVVNPATVEQPPPGALQPLSGDEMRWLRKSIADEGASRNKLMVLEQAARTHLFRVGQVKELLGLLPFSADKLRGLEMLAPRLVDGQNSFALYDAFAFSADKEKAREILKRSGY